MLDNDFDPEGDVITADLVDDVSNGTLTLNGDGSFVYTPNLGFNGEDSFIYVASDGLLGSDEAVVAITVVPRCTLNIELRHGDGELSLGFEVGTLEPAMWRLWAVVRGNVIPLLNISLPTIDPPITPSFTLPVSNLGTIGFLTTLDTPDGIICGDFGIVDTGLPGLEGTSLQELRGLFADAR